MEKNLIPTTCKTCKADLIIIPKEQLDRPGLMITGKLGFYCICPQCNLYPEKNRD
jgi:hypothetical protein